MSVFSSRSSDQQGSQRSSPDAVGRGMLGLAEGGQPTLFVLAGTSLGTTPVGTEGAPQWYDLRRLVNLDAIGEPVGARLPVEASFDGGPVLQAMWPEPFCDEVVSRLRELLESGQMLPAGAQSTTENGSVPPVAERSAPAAPIEATAQEPAAPQIPAPAPQQGLARGAPPAPDQSPAFTDQQGPAAPVPPAPPTDQQFVAAPVAPPPQGVAPGTQVDPSAVAPADAGLWAASDDRPLPGDGQPLAGAASANGELTLENVVYHGGYPGQTKKRKKCVAVLNAAGLTLNGPHGPDFHIGWDVVRTVEAQNADEAKFRIGVKARRRSTVVVFECDQGVTIVLEAQDVPTMPLKSALMEMLGGGSVKVA